LNKALFDIACDFRYGVLDGLSRRKSCRIVRINGDDIMFCGDLDFVALWREVTSHYGLVVNEEKTGLSRRWLELNSRSYDVRRHRFVAKVVLSFFRRSEDPADLLSQVVKGMATLSKAAFWHGLNALRWEISVRQIVLTSIPDRLWRQLIKRKWFRLALEKGPLPERVTGVDRGLPVTISNLIPRPVLYPCIENWTKELQADLVARFRGKTVAPLEKRIDRRYAPERRRALLERKLCHPRYGRSPVRWAFVWPKEILSFIQSTFPDLLIQDCEDEWIDDHPSLTTKSCLETVIDICCGVPLLRDVPPPLTLLVGVDNLPLLVS
jgi:hypothetical protein